MTANRLLPSRAAAKIFGWSAIARPRCRIPRRTTASRRRRGTGLLGVVQLRLCDVTWVSPGNRTVFGLFRASGIGSVGAVTSSSAAAGSLAVHERRALADLLAELGPDAPTCCEGWTTAHLAAHLVVRDRRPDAMPGYALEMVPGSPAWGAGRTASRTPPAPRRSYADLVEQVRSGAPRWSPLTWPGLEQLNVPEFAIHHEDVRRAQPGWAPRELPATRPGPAVAPGHPLRPPGRRPAGRGAAPHRTGPGVRGPHRRGRAHGRGRAAGAAAVGGPGAATSRG